MRFLLDEKIHQGLVPVLRELGHDIVVCPKGIANGDLLKMAVFEGRILFTHDTDFSKKPLASGHPGVVLVRISTRRFELFRKAVLELLKTRSSHDRYVGMLVLLWEDKIEVSPFSLS